MAVRLYWLDYEGKRVLYGNIPEGQTVRQPTFTSHPWVITDTNDKCLELYIPKAGNPEHILR